MMARALWLLALAACAVNAFGPPRPPPPGRRWSAASGDGGFDRDRYALPAAAVVGYGLGLGTGAVARKRTGSPIADAAAAGAPSGARDFSGRWRLEKSDNFDAYLKSLNVSAAHRRFATAATVDHEIEHDGKDLKICVINRLGKKCEVVTPGGPPLASTDTYGNPNTKTATWAPDGRTLKTEIASTVGRVIDERSRDDDAMVVKLTSPSGVVAYRRFRLRPGSRAPAADVGGAVAAVAPTSTPLQLIAPVAKNLGLVAAGFAGGVALGLSAPAPSRE